MKKILLIILVFLNFSCFAQNTVSNYKPVFIPLLGQNNKLVVAIRVFELNNIPSFLVVNPSTLRTSVVQIEKEQPSSVNHPAINYKDLINTHYYKLVKQANAAPYLLENHGIKHFKTSTNANVLTIDLCPSYKKFEKKFFTKLVVMAKSKKQSIPITIAISGRWLLTHPAEFQWLKNQSDNGYLQITWANHTFSHIFYKDLEYSKNFLLSPHVNLDAEVLLNEQYLIEQGETPSVFFRFPGLISDKKLIKKIESLGLIPLGADAWLAKDEKITPGCIILVHGNSNEHEGILLLMPVLDKLNLIDLKRAI